MFIAYRDKCYGFFIKLLGDRELAKDLTQDVFVRLIQKQNELSNVENWNNYIYLMCRNKAYDHLKKASHDKKYKEYLYYYWDQTSNIIPPKAEKKMEADHYREILEQSLNQLPDQQRLIFNLSKKEGLSHQKIAEQLNLSPITVRNHLHRAMKQLRSTTNPDIDLVLILISLIAPMVWAG
ncbi:RNA polymerase sigma-70 factor [Membranihabitans marinus]